MKNVLLLETHQEILNAHMQGDSPELGLYIPSKITNADIAHTASKFEIGKYYTEYGVYAGIFNQKHIFVTGNNLKDGGKCEFTWYKAMELTKDSEFKLPTIGECTLIWENFKAIQKGLEDNELDKLDGWYWSSSEYSSYGSWGLCVNDTQGLDYGGSKTSNYYVRPVLALPLQF